MNESDVAPTDADLYLIKETAHTITIVSANGEKEHLFFKPKGAILDESFVPNMRVEASNFVEQQKENPSQKVKKPLLKALGSTAFALSFYLVPIFLTVYKPGVENMPPQALIALFIAFPFLLVTSAQRAAQLVIEARDSRLYWESLVKMPLETYLSTLFGLKPLTISEVRNADTVRFLDDLDPSDQKARAVSIYDRYISELEKQGDPSIGEKRKR